jgi:prepilin-type N-terminal cleavage/methylation domain-containing protein
MAGYRHNQGSKDGTRIRCVSRRRRGFSLGEILVAVFIIAILAAAVIPTIYGRMAASRADADVGELQSLQQGIMLFYRDIGKYPRRLDYLNALPAPATTGLDLCGNALTGPDTLKFRGPYLNRQIQMINLAGGITKYLLATGDSVDALLTRTTEVVPNGGTQQILQIAVYGPDQATAEGMDKNVDGVIDGTSGVIQYVAAAPYVVKWTLPIKTGAC